MYDILFVELMPGYECFLPLAEKFKIPVIGTFSFRPWIPIVDVIGESHPLVTQSFWLPLPRKLGFFQRLQKVYLDLYTSLLIKYIWEPSLTEFYEAYFPSFNLQRHRAISVLFCSNYAGLFPTQLIPKVVEVAGIHMTPGKPLPQVSSCVSVF